METTGIVLLFILGVFFILAVSTFVWTLLYVKKFDPKSLCAKGQIYNGVMCVYPTHGSPSKYVKPTSPLRLLKFEYEQSLGMPWCTPTWYAYRYVDQNGDYGPMSDWTQTPVVAGSKRFPGMTITEDTCSYNRPTIGVDKIEYWGKGGVFAQLYQTPDNPANGEPRNVVEIGMLLPMKLNGKQYYGFPDIHNLNSSTYQCKGCDQ